jgi:YHS domain-containing protein
MKKSVFFLLAFSVAMLAAAHRWNDSAHAIGVIKAKGGTARHPVSLESGEESYILIATATVVPPYRGDVRVVLEGEPAIEYEIHAAGPIVDLGLHRWPQFRDNTFYGLKPRDRPALWIKMSPSRVDPVCGMADKDSAITATYEGKIYRFCSESCKARFLEAPARYKDADGARGTYTLAFYDTKTNNRVLTIPIIMKPKGELSNAGEHHH